MLEQTLRIYNDCLQIRDSNQSTAFGLPRYLAVGKNMYKTPFSLNIDGSKMLMGIMISFTFVVFL
jgi:hypothetical protein